MRSRKSMLRFSEWTGQQNIRCTSEAMNPRGRLAQLWKDLRPPAASDHDAGQRGTGRNRRAAITGGTAVLARAVQVSTSLITIPLAVHYLGNDDSACG